MDSDQGQTGSERPLCDVLSVWRGPDSWGVVTWLVY